MFRKTKELESLVEASRKALKSVEKKVEERDKLIKDLQEKIEVLAETNSDLRYENEELKLFKDKVVNTMNKKATIVDKYDIIKELISDDQSEN